jgi:hypothetical protein
VNDSTTWVPPEPNGPPLALVGAIAAGVGGAVLLLGLRVRKQRQEHARMAARARMRRVALLAASQLAVHAVRTVRRSKKAAPASLPARKGLFRR